MSASLEYENNVFRQSTGTDSDGGVRTIGTVGLYDASDQFAYRVQYSANYQQFFVRNVVDDVNQNFQASLEYQVTPRLQVLASERFMYTNAFTAEFFENDPTADDIDDSTTDVRNRDIQNYASLGFIYGLSSRIAVNGVIGHTLYDPEGERRIGSQTVNGSLDATYRLNRGIRAGAGVSATFQFFDAGQGFESSQSQIYQVYAVYLHEFTAGTRFRVRVGPAFILSEEDETPSSFSGQPVYPGAQFFPARLPDGSIGSAVAVPVAEEFGQPTVCAAGSQLFGRPVYVSGNCPVSIVPPVQGTFIPERAADPSFDTGFNQILEANSEGQTLSFDPSIQPAPKGSDSSKSTVFVSASLLHRWSENINSTLTYRRSQSDTSGEQGTTIRDAVTFWTNWTISPRWRLDARMQWRKRTSASVLSQTFVAVDVDRIGTGGVVPVIRFRDPVTQQGLLVSASRNRIVDNERYLFGVTMNRNLTRRLNAFLRFNLFYTASDLNGREVNDYRINLGLQYIFQPIRLWN
ncbi:hypothetical protein MK489_16075 [Myxococcota bacterium]|nr:hypothetical protein [Myxococcota bacterium]